MTPSGIITLHHGTTRKRAERIVARGPDPNYVEPGGSYYDPAGGFSTCVAGAPDIGLETPTDYAVRKDRNFSHEGGAVIVEVEVPAWIVDIVLGDPGSRFGADSGEVRFEPGAGLEELVREWPNLPKRIVPL